MDRHHGWKVKPRRLFDVDDRQLNFWRLGTQDQLQRRRRRPYPSNCENRDVARGHTKRLMGGEIKDYNQRFPGSGNEASDAPSRDDDRDDEIPTQILHTFVPSQVPKHSKIVLLPKEISSWLISLLWKLPMNEQLWERHTRTNLGDSGDGKPTANPSK